MFDFKRYDKYNEFSAHVKIFLPMKHYSTYEWPRVKYADAFNTQLDGLLIHV